MNAIANLLAEAPDSVETRACAAFKPRISAYRHHLLVGGKPVREHVFHPAEAPD